MSIIQPGKLARTYYGLSTDTKPAVADFRSPEHLGSLFRETDTGRDYLWNGTVWLRHCNRPPRYQFLLPSQVHVAAANTVHWDLFNASAAVKVRILSILQIPNITTAVTGIVFDWLLERTTAVGTGGSALTAWLSDTGAAALDASVTARSKPTGGATQSTDLRNYSLSSEETNAATIQIAAQGGLEVVPPSLLHANGGGGIVLLQNQGIRCVQITNSAEGNTGWLIGFETEPV